MKYSMVGPDGKTYSIDGPEGASPDEVKKRIKSQYKPSAPTVGDRVKGAASKLVSKAGDKITETAPFLKGGDTWPEIIGQTIGQGVGGRLGVFPGIVGGAVGGMAGDAAPDILKQTGQLLTGKKPMTPNWDLEKLKRSAARGATFSALGEMVPIGWRGAKAVGRTLREGAGALEGVGERLNQLRRLPLGDQLDVLRPGKSPKIPSPEVAGQQLGKVEAKYGIPSVEEGVDLDKAYGVSKKGASVGKTEVRAGDILKSKNLTPEARAVLEKELGPMPKEPPATVARKVHDVMKTGGEPTIQDAVVAVRHTANRLAHTAEDVPKMVLSKQYKRLVEFIGGKIEELGKARKLTHLANLREELMAAIPQSPKGEPYRFGIMRLIYMASSFIAGRFNPLAGVTMAAAMSPYMGALGVVGGDALTKVLDPILSSSAAGALSGGGLAAIQKKRSQNQ